MDHQRTALQQRLHVAWCVAGILGSLLLYGVMQERIMAEPFRGERFTHSLLLVLCNRLTTFAVAAATLLVRGLDARPQAPLYAYAAVSLSNVVATTCQYEALRYLSFPLQTLGKTSKMLPVMLWGAVILHKRYRWRDYAIAAAISTGCAAFGLSGSVAAKAAAKHSGLHTSSAGVGLMVTYLVFDGFTSTWQDRLFKGTKMTIYNQSLYVTLCSAGLSLAGLLTSRQLLPAVAFVTRHPEAIVSIVALSLTATLGQLFITHTIRSHGALLFATVMTSRQFLSIILSCIVFRHPLSRGQWVSTVVVFSALYAKSLSKKGGSKSGGSPQKSSIISERRQAASIGRANSSLDGAVLKPDPEMQKIS
mmetsp:Transcript_20699/g.62393  ORF Transcript_20699/g.62393 Transcript_20699/m.62393 type:complete len:363 (-) Transcript_20699:293-1381(-)